MYKQDHNWIFLAYMRNAVSMTLSGAVGMRLCVSDSPIQTSIKSESLF